ncbi:hypothetical protein VOLCADRAFT_107940, partial [Volvox carteri f. nagariensis]
HAAFNKVQLRASQLPAVRTHFIKRRWPLHQNNFNITQDYVDLKSNAVLLHAACSGASCLTTGRVTELQEYGPPAGPNALQYYRIINPSKSCKQIFKILLHHGNRLLLVIG